MLGFTSSFLLKIIVWLNPAFHLKNDVHSKVTYGLNESFKWDKIQWYWTISGLCLTFMLRNIYLPTILYGDMKHTWSESPQKSKTLATNLKFKTFYRFFHFHFHVGPLSSQAKPSTKQEHAFCFTSKVLIPAIVDCVIFTLI